MIDLLEKYAAQKGHKKPNWLHHKNIKLLLGSTRLLHHQKTVIIIAHLVSEFRQSKELLPDWLVRDRSIQKIEEEMELNQEQAIQKFEEIKPELYEILRIEEPEEVKKRSKEEMEQFKREVEQMVRNLSKKN